VILASAPEPAAESLALAVVAGRTLLERAVDAFRSAGVEDLVVVMGGGSDACERLRDYLRRDSRLRSAETGDATAGACGSFVAGASAAGRRFLLAQAGRVFEADVIRRLLGSNAPFALGVDGGAPIRDAGVAICDRSVAEAAARCLASGETSWDAVKHRWLAEGGEIEAVDLAGLLWADVAAPAERRRVERELVRAAARRPFDGPVFRYLNRRLSWRISLALVRLGVRPVAATASAFVIALLAAGVIAVGARSWVALAAGGFLVEVAATLDAVNGEIARASLRSSLAGTFFETVLDRIADVALLVALAVAAGLEAATSIALVVALAGTLLGTCVNASYEAVYRRPPPRPILRVSFGRDVRLLAIAIFAVAMQPFWGLVAVGVLAGVETGQRVAGAAIDRN
jgi:phosphatidylglycerophosphate synthase/choline kinase